LRPVILSFIEILSVVSEIKYKEVRMIIHGLGTEHYEGVSKSFRTESITKYTFTLGITR